MSKRSLRLHEKHSRTELVEMAARIKAERAGTGKGMMLYCKSTQRLLDDIGWAIYWHGAPQGNTRMQASQPQSKWW